MNYQYRELNTVSDGDQYATAQLQCGPKAGLWLKDWADQ